MSEPHRLKTLAQTHGVNYEFADLRMHPGYVSSAHLSFTAQATVLAAGQEIPVVLESAPAAEKSGSTCSGPCNTASSTAGPRAHDYLSCSKLDGEAFCDIRVLRFAQFGRVESPVAFDWLVTMVDDEGLIRGKMHAKLDDRGLLVYPASVELGGHMVVTVQIDGQEGPIRLRSRKEPIFRGKVPGWPPFGTELELENPPIEYFREDELDKPDAVPFMKVTANTVRLGTQRSDFFFTRPAIQTLVPVKSGGYRITWTDTASRLTDQKIVSYRVYRNLHPGNLEGWQQIAEVPVGTTSFVDRDAPADARVEYVVSHVAEYPFGYKYEGIFNPPVEPRPGALKPVAPDPEDHGAHH
jgi:hypothetical protein